MNPTTSEGFCEKRKERRRRAKEGRDETSKKTGLVCFFLLVLLCYCMLYEQVADRFVQVRVSLSPPSLFGFLCSSLLLRLLLYRHSIWRSMYLVACFVVFVAVAVLKRNDDDAEATQCCCLHRTTAFTIRLYYSSRCTHPRSEGYSKKESHFTRCHVWVPHLRDLLSRRCTS